MDQKPLPSNVTENHFKKTNIAKFILRLHELNLTVENSFFFLFESCLSFTHIFKRVNPDCFCGPVKLFF